MKELSYIFLAIILISSSVFTVTKAQAQDHIATQESIVSFVSNIVIKADNSADLTETITYSTGNQEHHGIFRDIYPYSSEGRKMSIENISVIDEKGVSYQYTVSNIGKNIRIKIGDPNKTFQGQKIYIIKYQATRAVAQLKDVDEIYWNVTGNEWPMPIYLAQTSVVLPSGATSTQSACYFGPKGSTNSCQLIAEKNGVYTFGAPSLLNPREGLTVAVGFSKGVVIPYSSSDGMSNFFNLYWSWLIAIILPILTFIFSLLYWYKKGRDVQGTGIIIPQYDVPQGLTPMEVGGIINEKVNTAQISAEIIYLATKGYIKIHQLEKTFIGLIKSTDYEIIKLKDFFDLQNDFDQKLLKGLFESQTYNPKTSSVNLSSLKYVFYTTAEKIISSVLNTLLKKGYYKNLGKMKSKGSGIFSIIFMAMWASVFFGGILGVFILKGNSFPMMVGIFFSVIIYGIISHFSPAKTAKGVAVKEYLLGLKNYLQIAEKDRLQFHNAPEKKPEVFEQLLPYAMVLGVANIWAKEFEEIYITPPSWYSGSTGKTFSAIAFNRTLSNFSSFTSSSLVSSPSSSGSGGGGSSGGGGGGGGGGSW